MNGKVVFLCLLQVARRQQVASFSAPFSVSSLKRSFALYSSSGNFYNDFEDYGDEDDDYIDTDSLGDWRRFRMNLAETGVASDREQKNVPRKSVSKENEAVLRSQSETLSREYETGVWSHETSVPEVGGLTLRMPIEVEIYRNSERNFLGMELRKQLSGQDKMRVWYQKAREMIEKELADIGAKAENGLVDGSILSDRSKEFLQLYIDSQETWQEVCLVVSRDEEEGTATSLILNRPIGFKVSENLGNLILNGAMMSTPLQFQLEEDRPSLEDFLMAFGQECAIYIGGPDEQDQPATIIHGFRNLPGAVEIAPGTNIYRGGMIAAVQGVLRGDYKALDFRFFVGKHTYKENSLDIDSRVGKLQPVACARAVALKQCISLPKPLWHEVMELCGGELQQISELEFQKRAGITASQAEMDDDEIIDELDQLDVNEDDEDDEDDIVY